MNSPTENISAVRSQRSNSVITEAEVAGKIGGYFGVTGSDPRITALLAKVFPEVQKAAAGNPASWESAFHGVIAQYEGYAKELGLGMSQAQRDMNALKHANRTDSTYASIAGRLGADGLRTYARLQGGSDDRERPLSPTGYRELTASANLTDRIGVTAKDFAGLERQFGHEAVAVAAQQIQDMGLRGKENLAYAAEYKNLSSALHDGDMDKAWALYESEKDPEKKKGMLQFMQNAISANSKKLEVATKDMPKDEAARVKQVYENYRRDQSDPKNKEAFEALQEKYHDNKDVSRVLTMTKDSAEKIAKAKEEQRTTNKDGDQKNEQTGQKNESDKQANEKTAHKNEGSKLENKETKAQVDAKANTAKKNSVR